MGMILLLATIPVSLVLMSAGNRIAGAMQAHGSSWIISATSANLAVFVVAVSVFSGLLMVIEVDPVEGTMHGFDALMAGVVWALYSAIWWAVMIVLVARSRAREGDK